MKIVLTGRLPTIPAGPTRGSNKPLITWIAADVYAEEAGLTPAKVNPPWPVVAAHIK